MERATTQANAEVAHCAALMPCARNGHSLVFDGAGRRSILFGGATGNGLEFSDVWEVRVDTARRCQFHEPRPDGPGPPARWGHSAVLRESAREMVVFGGSSSGNVLGDVWVLGLGSGEERWRVCRTRGIGPAPRSAVAAVYDSVRDSMVVFGGTGAEPFHDTWELRLATMDWRRLAVGGLVPDASIECAAAYDAAGDRMLLVTGRDREHFSGETWALDLSHEHASWDRLLTSGVPPEPRAGCAAALDTRARLLYVFGGWSYAPMVFHNDLCVLDVQRLAWRRIDIEGAHPDGRRLSAMSCDSGSGELLLFGGENKWRTYTGDVWRVALQRGLDFGPPG